MHGDINIMKNKIILIMSSSGKNEQDYQEFPYATFLIDEDKVTGGELEVKFRLHLKSIKKKSVPDCELFRRWLIGKGYKEIPLDENFIVF